MKTNNHTKYRLGPVAGIVLMLTAASAGIADQMVQVSASVERNFNKRAAQADETTPVATVEGESPREWKSAFHKTIIDRQWLESRLHQPRAAFRVVKSDDYVPQIVYVQVDPALSAVQRDAVVGGVATKVLWRSEMVPGLLKIEVAANQVAAACNSLLDRAEVIYAEPDYKRYPLTDPNDTRWDDMWSMKGNDGCRAQWAWDEFTGSSTMKVAIIDGAFKTDHPDLVDNLWVNPGEIAGNGIDDDNNGFVDDVHGYDFRNNDGDPYGNGAACGGHGTHVAGIVGAKGNNNRGVAGVNWKCDLVLLRCGLLDDGDCGISFTKEALEYAVLKAGTRVSNNSYGGYSFSQSMYDMIEIAKDYDHVFVAAAGNGGADLVGDNNDNTPVYPASYDLSNIISVANMNPDGTLRASSNFGPTSVDLGAPGGDVLSTIEGDAYGYKSGTSMASPHVAGAAALVIAQYPSVSYSICRARILNGVIDNDEFDQTVTGGVLNVHKALGVWLDFGVGGSHYGTKLNPEDDMSGALNKTPWTGVLNIKPVSSTWTGTIDQYVQIRAPQGTVTLGQ